MGLFDIIFLVLLLLFVVVGAVHGVIKTVFTWIALVCSILVTMTFASNVRDLIGSYKDQQYMLFGHIPMDGNQLGMAVAYLLLFVVSLIVFWLLANLFARVLAEVIPGVINHGLGVLMGAVQGATFIMLIIFLAGYTSIPSQSSWKDSMVVQQLDPGVSWVCSFFPAKIQAYFPEQYQHDKLDKNSTMTSEKTALQIGASRIQQLAAHFPSTAPQE